MSAERTPVRGNPGFAGETGEFEHLTEDDVRGAAFVGTRSLAGDHPASAASYPYQIAEREPDAPLFEGPYRERLEKIVTRYPTKQGALLPVLGLAQEIRGHLSEEALAKVAEALDLAPAYVRGVTTFYTMYNKRPVGRYLVQVCTNVCCNVCGADDVTDALLDELGVAMGEVTEDGFFTVMEAECLGACGFPTVVQVNNRYFENVTVDEVPDLLRRLREDGITTPQAPRSARTGPEATGSGAGMVAAAAEREAGPGTAPPSESGKGGGGAEKATGEPAPNEGTHRSPAVPPTEEPEEQAGPAGERATPSSRPHQAESPGRGAGDRTEDEEERG